MAFYNDIEIIATICNKKIKILYENVAHSHIFNHMPQLNNSEALFIHKFVFLNFIVGIIEKLHLNDCNHCKGWPDQEQCSAKIFEAKSPKSIYMKQHFVLPYKCKDRKYISVLILSTPFVLNPFLKTVFLWSYRAICLQIFYKS